MRNLPILTPEQISKEADEFLRQRQVAEANAYSTTRTVRRLATIDRVIAHYQKHRDRLAERLVVEQAAATVTGDDS